MKEVKTISLDGETYHVQQYITSYGLKLLTEIGVLLGEPIIQLVTQAKEGLNTELKPEQITSIMMGLTSRIDESTLDKLFKKILINTLIGNSSISVVQDYDTRFMGKYLHLFKLVFYTLEAQYSDFLVVLGGLKGFSEVKAPKDK